MNIGIAPGKKIIKISGVTESLNSFRTMNMMAIERL